MPKALVGADLHLAFDVLGDLAPQVTFDLEVGLDVGPKRGDLGLREIANSGADGGSDLLADLLRCGRPDPIGVGHVASQTRFARALHADTRAVAQRLVRAKHALRESRAEWRMPSPNELPDRLDDVLAVCYAMFGEGHAATGGDAAGRGDLCNEAIRLLEFLVTWPDTATPDAHALLALCYFTAARVPARVSSAQGVDAWTSLADQDRQRWDRGLIMRGLRAFDRASSGTRVSRYHVEAEIASLHSLAPSYAATPWPRIVDAYDRLLRIVPSRAAELSQAIAIAESGDLDAAWASLQRLGKSVRFGEWPNWLVACADIAERRGDIAAAIAAYDGAIASNLPEPVRRHLTARRARLGSLK